MTATFASMRRQLIDQAEHALRCWNVSTREHAAAMLPQWPFVDGLDDDMRVEVLGRFPLDEPLMVAGRDYLADEPKARQWRDREGDEWEESGDRLRLAEPGVVATKDRAFVEEHYGPLVEVVPQPAAEAEPCCDDHGNICGVVEYAHAACCDECPEFAKAVQS